MPRPPLLPCLLIISLLALSLLFAPNPSSQTSLGLKTAEPLCVKERPWTRIVLLERYGRLGEKLPRKILSEVEALMAQRARALSGDEISLQLRLLCQEDRTDGRGGSRAWLPRIDHLRLPPTTPIDSRALKAFVVDNLSVKDEEAVIVFTDIDYLDDPPVCGTTIGPIPHSKHRLPLPSVAIIVGLCWQEGDVGTTLHEYLHALGAVPYGAPNATVDHHCSDGRDIMCASATLNSGWHERCAGSVLLIDCNADDYFNPRPRLDSPLAIQNFNLAGPENHFIELQRTRPQRSRSSTSKIPRR